MRYNVVSLLRSPSGTVRLERLEALLELDYPEITVLAPVAGQIRLMRGDAGVLVEGKLTTSVGVSCVRCLTPVTAEVAFDISEEYRPVIAVPGGPAAVRAEEWDSETLIDEQNVLDVAEVVRQSTVLAVPVHPLCRPDCAGLCPTCGADLNSARCGCQPERDPRWEGLRAMLEGWQDSR